MDYTMKNFLFILAAIFALSSTQASADEDFYAGVFGGANWLNISGKSNHNSDSFDGERIRDRLKFDTGYIVGGSIGYRWCGGLRVEGEIAYRNNQRKKHHKHNDCEVVVIDDCSDYSYSSVANNNSNRGSNKHAQTVSYMANVLYDLPFECTPWKAYVGAGIGYAQQKGTKRHDRFVNDYSYDYSYSYSDCDDSSYSDSCYSSSSSNNCRKKHNKNNNGFAAQAIVGLGYNYCDCFELTLEYRYLYVSGRKNSNSNNNAIVVGAQTGF
jgi:opacity protein-like surface antigen